MRERQRAGADSFRTAVQIEGMRRYLDFPSCYDSRLLQAPAGILASPPFPVLLPPRRSGAVRQRLRDGLLQRQGVTRRPRRGEAILAQRGLKLDY
jgi:hypothetical protein